jgi:succinyl-diaminopimelate desuccinylase
MKLDEITLSQQLIKIPSLSGKNEEVINFLANYLGKIGFICNILEYDGDNSYIVNNLHAIYNPNNCDKILYFAGHSDVVAPGNSDSWKSDPFGAKIIDAKLYGRGASDMKCALACFIIAAEEFIKKNSDLNFGIGFIITNDEEADGINGTKKVLKWMAENNYKMSGCIVGEPSNADYFGDTIKIGRRGSINFTLKITGKQGHIAYPHNANNPITTLVNVLKIIKDHKFDNGNQYFDPSNLEISHISSPNLGNNVIPTEALANFNVRFNDAHNSKDIISLIEYACQKSCQGPGSNYTLTYKISGESFLSKPQELAKITIAAVKKITNQEPELSTSGGTSDARFIKDYCQIIEYGLVNKTAHQINEYAEIQDIKQLKEVYLEILKSY